MDISDLEALRREARRVLPHVDGATRLAGLERSVSVIRDRWGVPHVYAQTTGDLFFAQGFVHAQDRLWQMELRRRISSGRLAEVFGPGSLRRDIFSRTLGFQRGLDREWETYDEDTRAVITAYAAGVNAFIAGNLGRLPLEFQLVGFEPQPWTHMDVLTRAVVGRFRTVRTLPADVQLARPLHRNRQPADHQCRVAASGVVRVGCRISCGAHQEPLARAAPLEPRGYGRAAERRHVAAGAYARPVRARGD